MALRDDNGNGDGLPPLATDTDAGVDPESSGELEAAPLLTSPSKTRSTAPASPSLYPYALIFVFALTFLADVGGSLLDTPEVRLLEMAVCRDYYRVHDPSVIGEPPLSYVDEKLCKLNRIQADLAYLGAAKGMLATIPGILFTIPYGHLSDRVGRKPIMLLGLLGQLLSFFWTLFICYFHQTFSTQLVLISPAFLVVGGGSRVLSATLYSIIVDVSPENMRTTIFYVMGAAVIVTDIVMAPIGSWLLMQDLWLPFKFSSLIMLLAVPVALSMPETLAKQQTLRDAFDNGPVEASGHRSLATGMQNMRSALQNRIRSTTAAFRSAWSARELRLCLTAVFLFAFASRSGSIFVQYASKVLDWPMAKTGYLISVNGLVTLGVLVSFAVLSQVLERRAATGPPPLLLLDVSIVRASAAVLAMGTLLMGLGRTPTALIAGYVLTGGGYGIYQALQGLLASFTDKTYTGQIYASAALVELVARLTGAIAFAKFFDIGLGLPSWGIGFPFFVASTLHLLSSLVAFLLPTRTEASV